MRAEFKNSIALGERGFFNNVSSKMCLRIYQSDECKILTFGNIVYCVAAKVFTGSNLLLITRLHKMITVFKTIDTEIQYFRLFKLPNDTQRLRAYLHKPYSCIASLRNIPSRCHDFLPLNAFNKSNHWVVNFPLYF